MAGMLAGVETARRRRFHQGGGGVVDSPTRRLSLCLYTTSHIDQYHLTYNKQRTSATNQDEKLGEAAREAKQRLDERLSSAQWKSQNKRSVNNRQQIRQGLVVSDNLQRDGIGLKKNGSMKRFNWAKLGWKASEQLDECAICLDQFRVVDNLMHLRCAHKFHSKCLVPWLESNAHCPCCRMEILTTPRGE